MPTMQMPATSRTLRARWVFPVAGPPLRDAAVTLAEGRIVAVGRASRSDAAEDLGQVAIVPGLVNAHTHLEFSDLRQPIGRAGQGLADWLAAVIERRAGTAASAEEAIAQGLVECAAHGVTTIGEIVQPGRSTVVYRNAACDGTIFAELIAPGRTRVEAALAAASGFLGAGRESKSWVRGLSPHAPYSVHPDLLAAAVRRSAENRIPLAMHLAESREEIEFLRHDRGPFRDLLESRGAWEPHVRPPGARPLDELRALARADWALVIHGNYLDDEEVEFLGRQPRMAVVYCPRTHAWFGHEVHPLERLLAAGALVALGTDSRASSPDLSLLAEMRQVARTFPAMSRATVLELGTLRGARALGREAEIGTIEPGKLANLAVIALPDEDGEPHELLLEGGGQVVETWFRGRRCWPVV